MNLKDCLVRAIALTSAPEAIDMVDFDTLEAEAICRQESHSCNFRP